MIKDILKKWCASNGIDISDNQLGQFEEYARMLKEWNEKMNLTAITDDEGIAIKHFIDSISILKSVDPEKNARILDVGTGAGFPGIPLKIMRPDIDLTLLDSLNKRLVFLDAVCKELDITAELVHSRAEESSQKPEFREQFDIVVSRAVANLPALCEYCIPYVRKGGLFLAMKGPDGEKELEAAGNALKLLGGSTEKTDCISLPDGSSRTLVLIRKTDPTPSKYPRRGQKINKNPL